MAKTETIADARRKYWQDMEQAEKRIRAAHARMPEQALADVRTILATLETPDDSE